MKRKIILDVALYFVSFAIIQMAVSVVSLIIRQTAEMTPTVICVTTLISSILTIVLFAWRKWARLSGTYINTRPWFTLFWVACLSVGSILPMTFAVDSTGLQMPQEMQKLFSGIMSSQFGLLAVGFIGPIAEEVVFRGAILRRLLDFYGNRGKWTAIVLTALLFGAVHGNLVQGINAFTLGLLLGWMYSRTRSIVPGIVFHIVNNTISVIVMRLYPAAKDMTLVEFYGGDMTRVWLSVVFSLMIFGAALYQLNLRLNSNYARLL